MACYVDDVEHAFGNMKMCHLWADTEHELFEMVDKIGVLRKWVQRPPKASWLHFDIAKSKRILAIRAGAFLTDQFGPAEHVARLDMASGDPARAAMGARKVEQIKVCRERRQSSKQGESS